MNSAPAMPLPPLLQFSKITFGYPATLRPVMQSFNLDIPSGSVTAILGPNGAGKTTLLHLALGWLKAQHGDIFLNGRMLAQFSRRELGQQIALVPQKENTSFSFSLLEYVLLGRAPYLPPLGMPGEADARVAVEALARVGLESMKDRSILSLSGGERQLVLVARALAQQPQVLLLDEPTSHLDLGNKGRLVHLLKDLRAQGVTIILTTHEPDVASALATHLVLVQKGRVLETGSMDEVFTSASLTRLYQLPVEVTEVAGHKVVLWN
jgi:iron complex transport system ATP-binding protein